MVHAEGALKIRSTTDAILNKYDPRERADKDDLDRPLSNDMSALRPGGGGGMATLLARDDRSGLRQAQCFRAHGDRPVGRAGRRPETACVVRRRL